MSRRAPSRGGTDYLPPSLSTQERNRFLTWSGLFDKAFFYLPPSLSTQERNNFLT
jgi:hypothetical protein